MYFLENTDLLIHKPLYEFQWFYMSGSLTKEIQRSFSSDAVASG